MLKDLSSFHESRICGNTIRSLKTNNLEDIMDRLNRIVTQESV